MSQVWVRAKAIVYVSKNGQTKTYHPGDWCSMGKQQARKEWALGNVEILRPVVLQSVQDLHDCAILFKGEMPEEERLSNLRAKFPGLPLEQYTESYPTYSRFLLWDTSAKLRQELIATGFHLLTNWQLAAPLLDYTILAANIGQADRREKLKGTIHDLRVPVYDYRVLFVRNCSETRTLFELWQHGDHLDFLEALYKSRPVIDALPPNWIMQ